MKDKEAWARKAGERGERTTEGQEEQLGSRTLLRHHRLPHRSLHLIQVPKAKPPALGGSQRWPSPESPKPPWSEHGHQKREMGVWAGPGWPEAGLRTKPPGSPYLGRGRRAVPRGSPRRPSPAPPSPRGPWPDPGPRRAPSPPANSAPSGQWAPSPAPGRGDTKAGKRGPARSQASGK